MALSSIHMILFLFGRRFRPQDVSTRQVAPLAFAAKAAVVAQILVVPSTCTAVMMASANGSLQTAKVTSSATKGVKIDFVVF